MKTIRLLYLVTFIGIFGSTFAQSAKPEAKKETTVSMFFVQIPHTKEDCMTALVDMKSKGDDLLSKFEYGCMSGDHTAYGFLEGTTAESIKQSLPGINQKNAKVVKVKKFTAAEIEKMHHGSM